MKRIISVILVISLVAALAGCSKEDSPDTLGQKYVAVFDKSKETTADAVVSELLNQVETEISLDKVDVTEGYLAGFDN